LFARQQDNNHSSKGRSSKPAKRPPQPKQNTAVYVTGLPSDATAEEVAELFSRKCGVIAEEIDSGRPRIKMYTDADGKFKGDALVVFFKPQSVDMAIMLLDDTDFRFGESTPTKMHVQAADSSYKKTKYDGDNTATKPVEGSSSVITTPSASQPSNPPQNRRNDQDKAKIIRKTQKLSAKLADWSDDEPSSLPGTTNNNNGPNQPPPNISSKHDRTIILTHMFTLAELASDPTAILEIKDDIREECSKLGVVTNVVLYDEELEGIVCVCFQSREASEACLRVMHGRAFAGQIVEAFFATGKEGFKRSRGEGGGGKAGEEEED
jgi:HIV Tat-specific factor 1